MKLRELASMRNLRLAWRRITTGGNSQYKKFFRMQYYAYELALEENLRDLRSRVVSGAWKATTPERVYMPKPSGLQRPLTLLHLEDQVVLQALANIVAHRVEKRRKPLLFKSVFSNVPQAPDDPFFLRDWHRTYAAFGRTVEHHFLAGRLWMADFDLAAFYDTISHDLLLRTPYPRSRDSDGVKWLEACLGTWTTSTPGNAIGHGLPQGPIASDFLAEVFLLPIDEGMRGTTGYVRYVDDVRLFARTESDIRAAVVRLEIHCRERGLIPQVGKFALRKARSVAEARAMLPSIGGQADSSVPRLSARVGEILMRGAVGGRPWKVKDKTRLRYVLFRARPSARLLQIACMLIARYPEHIDACAAFLSQYGYRKSIRDTCLQVLGKSPYDYVQGELWHILSRFYREDVAFDRRVRGRLTARAKDVVRQGGRGATLRWGAGHFLCVAEERDGRAHTRFLASQPGLVKGLVAPALPRRVLKPGGLMRRFLKCREIEPGLGLVESLHAARVTLQNLGIRESAVPRQVCNVLRRLELASGRVRQVDIVDEIIMSRYGVAGSGQWKRLLGAEYLHAVGLLVQADSAFLVGPSHWLSHQNSFNQAVFLALQRRLAEARLDGVVRTHRATGELLDFGVTLDPSNAFSQRYAGIADCFRDMNRRRNKLPGSHPYDKKTAIQTQFLKGKERDAFASTLRRAYAEIITLWSQLSERTTQTQ